MKVSSVSRTILARPQPDLILNITRNASCWIELKNSALLRHLPTILFMKYSGNWRINDGVGGSRQSHDWTGGAKFSKRANDS